MVSPTELAAMQAVATAYLDRPCTVQRTANTPDGAGHWTEAATTIYSGNCNQTQPTAALMAMYHDVIGSQVSYRVRFPANTDIRANDIVTIGSDVLRVQAVLAPVSYQTATSVLASEVR